MAVVFIDPQQFNRVLYDIAGALKKEIKDEASFKQVSAQIMDRHGVPEGSRDELVRQLPYYWRSHPQYERDSEIRSQVLKLLVPDGNARKKALHLDVSRALDQAQFHENLDSLMALAKLPEGAAQPWVYETAKEMETLLSKLEGLGKWREAARAGGLDAKDDVILTFAHQNLVKQAFAALKESARLDPSVFDAWLGFSSAAKDRYLDAAELTKVGQANLDARLAGQARGERRAIDDAPAFFVAVRHGVATDEQAGQFQARLAGDYPQLAAKWNELSETARYAAQQLAGTPRDVPVLPAKSLTDLDRLLVLEAHGAMTLEQLRPALTALAAQIAERGYAKDLTAATEPKELGPELVRLHRALHAANELGVKVDAKAAGKALEQLTKNWVAAIPKGETPVAVVFSVFERLVKSHGGDEVALTSSLTQAIAEGCRKSNVDRKEVAQLIFDSLKDGAKKPFATALCEALINDALETQREPKGWYYSGDRVHPTMTDLIPRAYWEPILTDLAVKHPPQSPAGVRVVNALSAMDRASWIEAAASQYFLGLGAAAEGPKAAGGLDVLRRAIVDGKHTILETTAGIAGFGRDGDTYYTAENGKVWTTDSKTGERKEFIDLEKWKARAIRVGGDQVVVLSDLNGAGWISVHDKETGEKLRRRALPRPINHAANTSAVIAANGRVIFPESKHGKADFIVSMSPDFDKDRVDFKHQTAPRGFKSELVAMHGDQVYAVLRNHGKQQLQITRYDGPELRNGQDLLADMVMLAPYHSASAVWFVGDRIFVSDRSAVHVMELEGDRAKPAGSLPLKSVLDAMPRPDGGLDLLIGNDAFDEQGKGSRLVRLSAKELQEIFG